MFSADFYLWFQAINILILILWLGLAIYALFQIRDRQLSGNHQIVWTLIVLMIPVLGALAFLIVSPKD
jgi:hypothetical protein